MEPLGVGCCQLTYLHFHMNYLKERADFLEFSEDGYDRFYKCTKGVPFYINTFARLMSSDKLLTEEIVKKEFYKAFPYLAIHLKSM